MRKFLKHFPFNKVFTALFVALYTFLPSAQGIGIVIAESSVDKPIEVGNSQGILADGISDPKEIANPEVLEEEVVEPTFEDGVYTVNSVELKEYVYPDNEDVRVKFTNITEEGNLVISKVELTEEEKEELNTYDDYGWDITSTMSNGSFTYDLTLPNTSGNDDVEVKYTEDGEVYTSIEEVVVNEEVIYIEGLEHFSIYYVANRVPSAKPVPVEAETIPTWCDIIISEGQSIQEAINKSEGTEEVLTVCIKPGVYEENLIIYHPVKLIALLKDPRKEEVVIKGTAEGSPTIAIKGTKNVEINGLTIVKNESPDGGLFIDDSTDCLITNNKISGNKVGIKLFNVKNSTLKENIFNGNQIQITIDPLGDEGILEKILSQNKFDGAIIARSQTKSSSTVTPTIFGTIQVAVDSAGHGDVLDIYHGTYEEIVNISKPLSLVGVEEKSPTILGRFEINTSGTVNIVNMNFQVPVPVANPIGNSADSIHINKVGKLYVDNCSFDGSNLFLLGGRGIISDNLESNVTVGNSNFTNGYYTAIQGKYNELFIYDSTISNCKSGINFQGGNNLAVKNTDISVVAQGATNDTYAVRFASGGTNTTGNNMALSGGTYLVDKNGFTADSGIYHSAIIVRSGASGELKANNLSLGGEVVNLSGQKLDATNNWWGTTTQEDIEALISGDVEFCPWFYTNNTTETGELFGPCIDHEKPVIKSVTYLKNSTPITVQGTGSDPVYVKSVSELSYNASFSDDLKLGKHVFVIYQENPESPGTPYWVGNGGTAYCSFTGTTNTFALGGKNDSLSNVSFENCTTELPEGRYVVVNRVYDAVGKFSESYDLTFVVDTTEPTSSLSVLGNHHEWQNRTLDNTWKNLQWFKEFTEVILKLNGEENDFINYAFVGENNSCTEATYSIYTENLADQLNLKANGIHKLCYYAEDLAGNKEAINKQILKLDTTRGTSNITSVSGNNIGGIFYTQNSVKITAELKDEESGIARTRLYITDKSDTSTNVRSVMDDTIVAAGETHIYNSFFNDLPDGEYYVRVMGYDKAQNHTNTDRVDFVIDDTDPSGTIDYIYYDSKDVKVDTFITNDNTPAIGGTSNDNFGIESVDVKIGSYESTAGAGGPGFWHASFSDPIPDGTYLITLTLTDFAGNETVVTKNITIDTLAPTAQHTYYKDGTAIIGSSTYVQGVGQLSFKAEYFDESPSSGILKDSYVIFDSKEDGSGRTGTAYCSWRDPNNTLMITTNPLEEFVPFTNCEPTLADGQYYMYHQVYDNATRKDIPSITQFSDVKGLYFVVDTEAPISEINIIGNLAETKGLNHNNGWHGKGWYYNFTEVKPYISSGSELDDNETIQYEILNNEVICPLTLSSPIEIDNGENIATTINSLSDGVYTLCYQAKDSAGNLETPNQITFKLDRTNPEYEIKTATINGNEVNGVYYIASDTISFNIHGSDNSSGYFRTRYDLFEADENWNCTNRIANGVDLSEAVLDATQALSLSDLEDGRYCMQIWIYDDVQNKSWYDVNNLSQIHFVIDNSAPLTPSGLYFKDKGTEDVLPCDSYSNLHNNLTEFWSENTESDLDHYEYSSFNAPNGSAGLVNEPFNTNSFDSSWWNIPMEGMYSFKVRAVDYAGNPSEYSEMCNINIDWNGPVIAGHSSMILTEGDSFPTDTVTLTDNYELNQVCVKAEDKTGTLGASEYFCVDIDTSNLTGDQFSLANEIRKAIEDWQGITEGSLTTIDLDVLPEGQYEISYYATDKAGNPSTTETFTVTINDNIPTVEITADNTEITQGDEDIVLGTNITNGNSPYTYLWGGDCTGTESITTFPGNSEPGEYTCTITVTDEDGDTATDSVEIIVGAVLSGSIEENGNDTTGNTLGIQDSSMPTTAEEVLGAIFTPKPVQASTQSLLGTGGYLYTQATNEEQNTEEEETTKEETVTQEEDAEVKGEEDNGEQNSEEETTEEETKWWVYPLVILPVLALFLILWKRRKEEDEPQF